MSTSKPAGIKSTQVAMRQFLWRTRAIIASSAKGKQTSLFHNSQKIRRRHNWVKIGVLMWSMPFMLRLSTKDKRSSQRWRRLMRFYAKRSSIFTSCWWLVFVGIFCSSGCRIIKDTEGAESWFTSSCACFWRPAISCKWSRSFKS